MFLQGVQPFEMFREQRRSARFAASSDVVGLDHDGTTGMEIDNALEDVGKQVSDRRSARRKAGHGCSLPAQLFPIRTHMV